MEERQIKQAVILAGGYGERMKPFTEQHPKPMYPFQKTPFIDYLIKQIKGFGITKVLLLLGYMADQIQDFLGDGEHYDMEIEYCVTPPEYDTGNRLFDAEGKLDDAFLLMYCDNYCPIHFQRLCQDFFYNNADIQISVYRNADQYTKYNVRLAANGMVSCYDKKRVTDGLQGVDIGYAIIKKSVLKRLQIKENNPVNFEGQVYPIMVEQGTMFGTQTEHRYYSIGSWKRIELTKEFFSNPKTLFLDRDGTLNVRPPKACYVEKPEDFKWIKGSMEAVRILKEAGWRLILVSNQPGIARGNLTRESLEQIHKKMQEDLKRETGYELDALYYCPHNWDENCECRKPKPGLLYQAQKDFSLDLTKCYLIGDDERDIQAGEAAGCHCIMVNETYNLLDAVKELLNIK